MDRMLYIAMSGAKEIMLAQANTTNNLANANTVGFKRDLEAFKAIPIEGPGYASRVYTQDEGTGTDFTQGPLITTGRSLDVAINGPGWIAVQGPNGQEAYTRAGELKVNSNGLLTTNQGYPVIGNSGPIAVPPNQKIEIGADGTITVLPSGQQPSALAVVDRIKLVNPPDSQLAKGLDGLMHTRNGQPLQASANVSLVSGALEGSNVNTVNAMVKMISLARQYEMQVKMMKTAETNDQASAQLIRLA
ncbi:flagellar basal-body rod protein FlgF [Acidihalobacter aeolianus]|uniref:Flagellar basal-body rod protein FlgF n=1 Tax=Acidihalobacter aeolianus TaxID=2792603 RepID=A0A1D8K6Q8_9GAMM|nr:flagellar basal-body rod protein FlgF [Acidihalobacter aeolianus]AOV16616.1 flagellar basal-body rod protein FlgF [Acidihalobacter aeolianus]